MTRLARNALALAALAALASTVALIPVPASAGMLGKAAVAAAATYGLKKAYESCMENPACRDEVTATGTALLSKGIEACGGIGQCGERASRAAGLLGNLASRDRTGGEGGNYGATGDTQANGLGAFLGRLQR